MSNDLSSGAETEAEPSGLARIRVHARGAGGERVPMVGLLHRSAIEGLRRKLLEESTSATGRLQLTARVTRVESVRVSFDRESDPVAARRVYLELSVKEAPTRPTERARQLRAELSRLVERETSQESEPAPVDV